MIQVSTLITEDKALIEDAKEVYIYHKANGITYAMTTKGQSQGIAIILPNKQFHEVFKHSNYWAIPPLGYPNAGENCPVYTKREVAIHD